MTETPQSPPKDIQLMGKLRQVVETKSRRTAWKETIADLPNGGGEDPFLAIIDSRARKLDPTLSDDQVLDLADKYERLQEAMGLPEEDPTIPHGELIDLFLAEPGTLPASPAPELKPAPPLPDWLEEAEPAAVPLVAETVPEPVELTPAEMKEGEEVVTGIGLSAYPEDPSYSLDTVTLVTSFGGNPDQVFAGVYNGRGSPRVSEIAAEVLHQNLLRHLNSGEAPPEALKGSYLDTDQQIIQGRREFDYGAEAITAFIRGKDLFIANVGNIQAVLCRGKTPIRLSSSHTTALQTEKDRVAALGGSENTRSAIPVAHPREGGVFAITRILGNPDYKRFTTAEPAVSQTRLLPEDKFLILGSEGLWRTMDDQQAVALIGNEQDPKRASDILKREALRITKKNWKTMGVNDITVVVVKLWEKSQSITATEETTMTPGEEIQKIIEPVIDELIPGMLPEEKREPKTFILSDGRRVEAKLLTTAGAFAYIYTGRYEGESEDSVVIKVGAIKEEEIRSAARIRGVKEAHVWTSQEIMEHFAKEAKILEDLRDKGSTHTPRVHDYHAGAEADFTNDPPSIVMDLAKGFTIDFFIYGEHLKLVLAGETVGYALDERTALEIVSQMVETMDFTLQAGYYNGDTKMVAENFLWDGQSRKLMFIDWNSADVLSETNYNISWIYSQYLTVARNTLRHLLTGGMGWRKLVGSIARQEMPDAFDRLADLKVYSPGTRDILKKAFAPRNSYPDLASLKADLKKQLAVLGVPAPEPARENLGQEMQRLQTRNTEVVGRLRQLLGMSEDEFFQRWIEEELKEK